eukprot:15462526-Alexandrium_andersonii.AAC.1
MATAARPVLRHHGPRLAPRWPGPPRTNSSPRLCARTRGPRTHPQWPAARTRPRTVHWHARRSGARHGVVPLAHRLAVTDHVEGTGHDVRIA